MAFARVKMYWAKMKATDIAAKSPLGGKDKHTPEHYFEDVLRPLDRGSVLKGYDIRMNIPKL